MYFCICCLGFGPPTSGEGTRGWPSVGRAVLWGNAPRERTNALGSGNKIARRVGSGSNSMALIAGRVLFFSFFFLNNQFWVFCSCCVPVLAAEVS